MITRLVELIVILAAIGGGMFAIHYLITQFRTSREEERLRRVKEKEKVENERVIAISKAATALKKRDKGDLEFVLNIYGRDMGEEMVTRVRDMLLDIAIEDK